MWKELIELWKSRGLMIKVVDLFGKMLEDTLYVFQHSWRVYTCQLDIDEEKQNVYSRDKEINQKEREIRKLLVEHLTINPGNDAPGCLAIMSMVKDVERIGDYSKNIFDLAMISQCKIDLVTYKDKITTLQEQIEISLRYIKDAFVNSDETLARKIIAQYEPNKKDCNAILYDLFKQDIPRQEALITVLLARYLKRINSHVSNVASGIILPLDQIDFVKGGLLE
jgi:phosphate uptake regulator